MKNFKNFIILITIINFAQIIQSEDDEIIELNCDNQSQCKQFEHSGRKSVCLQEQCQCTSSAGERVKCQPLNSKVNNIIGGQCPCKIPNANCDKKQNICYCISEFTTSRDKRRCIPKTVALDKKCEETSQCQKGDFNAICPESKECKCMDQFANEAGKCVSILGKKSFMLNDTQCIKEYGANTRFSHINQQCICVPGYFASIDNSKCLKISKYLENCTENIQCIGTMGPGGTCAENVCQCSEKYFVEEKRNDEGVSQTVCTPVVERGQYCHYEEDCYQRQLSEAEQSMRCLYGECNCKEGFYSFNEGACLKGSGAGTNSLINWQFFFIHLIIVIFCK